MTMGVVAITGAGTGLGRAYALYLARLGWRVVVNNRLRRNDCGDVMPSSAEAVVAEICAAGGEAISQHDDVCSDGAGERLLHTALERWGRLDALVNNAGVDQHVPFHKITLDDFRRIVAVNFDGTVAMTQPIYQYMRERRHGRIVVSVSSAGLHGLHGLSAYAASKAALVAFMRSLAAEGASRDVTCAAIAPYAATRMTDAHFNDDLRRVMTADVVAPVVAALIAPQHRISGETWVVGAGRVRRASTVEWGEGFPIDDALPQRLAARVGEPREFRDALAAHEDFMQR